MEKIFQISVEIHGKQAVESEIVVDTTVQEKNITFPTDTKLRVKVIAKCWKIAMRENLVLRRSYGREIKKILRTIRFNHRKNAKLRNSAIRRGKTTANALLNDIARKLTPQAREALDKELQIHSGTPTLGTKKNVNVQNTLTFFIFNFQYNSPNSIFIHLHP